MVAVFHGIKINFEEKNMKILSKRNEIKSGKIGKLKRRVGS